LRGFVDSTDDEVLAVVEVEGDASVDENEEAFAVAG
jgi:hypothetical protein